MKYQQECQNSNTFCYFKTQKDLHKTISVFEQHTIKDLETLMADMDKGERLLKTLSDA